MIILPVILSILKIIGIILLVALLVILILIAFILFVPIRYGGSGRIIDPEGNREMFDTEYLKAHSAGEFHFSWLLHLVSGKISVPDEPRFLIRAAFWKFDLLDVLKRAGDKKEEKSQEKEQQPDTGLVEKFQKALQNVKYYVHILQQPYSEHALKKAARTVTRVLRKILPGRWQIAGTVGLGDPQATGRLLEALGILYPVTAGHIEITPEFMKYQADAAGFARGKIRIWTLLTAALGLIFDRDVRHFLHRMRKKPVNKRAQRER